MANARKGKTRGFGFIATLALALIGFTFLALTLSQRTCANPRSCKESLELSVENGEAGTFSGQEISPPQIDLTAETDLSQVVLGEAPEAGEKRIYIDLSSQTLTAYEGDAIFLQTKISSGKWGRTPTGEFRIWQKLRATKMSGGSGSDYYYLPNVPYVMFFSNDEIAPGRGFGLHGTYWHNNFGYPMSHGCINLRTVDAEKLYHWVNPEAKGNITPATDEDPGTLITIYGKAPN